MINIVLYEPEIPQNTGNIMRTCAGTGAKLHLIGPLGFSLSDNMIKRSGVNYIEHCDYSVYDDYNDFLSKNSGDIYLIFGKESTGIPKEILHDNLDKCARIPTNDNIRALNVSNSVAIVLFEALRQQNFPDLLHFDTQKGKDYLIKE